MKRLITPLLVIVAALNSFGAKIQVKVSGLEATATATISIASYTY